MGVEIRIIALTLFGFWWKGVCTICGLVLSEFDCPLSSWGRLKDKNTEKFLNYYRICGLPRPSQWKKKSCLKSWLDQNRNLKIHVLVQQMSQGNSSAYSYFSVAVVWWRESDTTFWKDCTRNFKLNKPLRKIKFTSSCNIYIALLLHWRQIEGMTY